MNKDNNSCPNKNLEEYKVMVTLLGSDDTAEYCWYHNSGQPIWLNPDGTGSMVYNSLREYNQNIEDAVGAAKKKSWMFTKGFKERYPDLNEFDKRKDAIGKLNQYIAYSHDQKAVISSEELPSDKTLNIKHDLIKKDGTNVVFTTLALAEKKSKAINADKTLTYKARATLTVRNKTPVYYIRYIKKTAFTTSDGDITAFYDETSGEITLTKAGLTAETVIHEFSHPFIDALEKNNPELFNNLISEIVKDSYIPAIANIIEHVNNHYSNAEASVLNKELLAYIISEYGKGNIDPSTGTNTASAIQRFFKWLSTLTKDLIDQMTSNKTLYVDQIHPNTNYKEITDLFTVYSEIGDINLGVSKFKPEILQPKSANAKANLEALKAKRKAERAAKEDIELPPAYKAITHTQAEFIEITNEAAHMSTMLPKEITTNLVEGYVRVLSGGKKVVGMFQNAMITLSTNSPRGTAYHEGFHAVFRTLLSEKEQVNVINEIKDTHVEATSKDILDIQMQYDISAIEAEKLYYEELLADEFPKFMDGSSDYNYSSGIKGFFQKLADWFKYVFNNNTTVRRLFGNIKAGKYTESIPNIVTGIAYKVHPYFSAGEVLTITKELASVAFKNIGTVNDLKVNNASMIDVQDAIIDAYIEAEENGNDDVAGNIEAILNEDNTGIDQFWLKEIDSYMRNSLGLKVVSRKSKDDDSDSDQLEALERDNFILNSYEVSGKIAATSAVKFMVAMTNKVSFTDPNGGLTVDNLEQELSAYTGLPILVDYGSLYNDIENILADTVAVKVDGEYQDGLLVMIEALRKHVKYKPELLIFIEKLESSSEEIRSQVFGAFSKQKGSYVHHQVIGSTDTVVESRFTNSSFNDKSTIIRDSWVNEFNKVFGVREGSDVIYNKDAINYFNTLRTEVGAIISNEVVRVQSNSDRKVSAEVLSAFQALLKFMGVNINDNTLNYVIESNIAKDSTNYNYDYANELDQLFFKFQNATNDLATREGSVYGNNNQIQDNSSFFKSILATADSYFKIVSGENSFVGPGGNQIYTYQNNDSVSKKINAFKAGDLSHLKDLSVSAYSKNSLWIKEFLYPLEVQNDIDNFTLEMYGNLKSESRNQDTGEKASTLDPSEAYMDNVNKTLSGYYIGLAEADKSKQTYFKGPKIRRANEGVKILRGYFADEISRIRIADAVIYGTETSDPAPEEEWYVNYHYYEVKAGTGTIGKNLDKVPGNAFNSYLFPRMNLKTLGLLDSKGKLIPLTKSLFDNNAMVNSLVTNAYKNLIKDEIENAVKLGLITKTIKTKAEYNEDGVLTKPEEVAYSNRLISDKIIHEADNNYKIGDQLAINQIFGDYVLNSIIGSIEQTKLFNGDPACYKVKGVEKGKSWGELDLFSDFMKRTPAVYASGKDFRIYKTLQGEVVVRDTYNSATIKNIMTPSAFFSTSEGFNEENINAVAEVTQVPVSEIKELFKDYLDINQTDAQAWITLDTYKERMNGLGKWTDSHEEAYNKMNNGEALNALELGMFAQPLKTVHSELVKTKNNEFIMHYNKQSEAVLLPFMKDLGLGNLMAAMENNDVDHVIVIDGKKSGAVGVTDIMENGSIKNTEDIALNPVKLSYNNLFLQQDLTAKHIHDTTIGSQGTKNVIALVALDEEYFHGIVGQELLSKYHETIGRLSDMGLINLDKELGYNSKLGDYEQGVGNSKVRKLIQREFEGEASENTLNALNDDIVFDALPIKNKIMNKLMAIITKKTVKLKQSGGALVQLSDLGFIATETSLTDKVKNGIIWFKDPRERLQPMHIKDGEVKAAQVLIPHSKFIEMLTDNPLALAMLEEKFGVSDYKELTHKQISSVLGKEVMSGFSYRIPNQAAASNDAFEIVGVLPIEMGDTMVSFSDITVKTGSDFDIDKAYIILPNFFFNSKSKKIEKVQYDINDLQNNSEKAMQNLRLDLMRQMLLHPSAYTTVMSPLDSPELSDYTKKLFPANEKLKNVQFFTGSYQLSIKAIFDKAKTLVGSIANHMTHNSLVQPDNLFFTDYYFGKGVKIGDNTSISNKISETGKSISKTLGMFMNAIVDAAKDPFIIRANINQYTANTAFTMLRAGIDMEWTVAFIGQPIIKSVVEAQENQEGRFGRPVKNSAGNRLKSLESVIQAYGLEVTEAEFRGMDKYSSMRSSMDSSITTTKEELESNINSEDKESYTFKQEQLKILKQFLEWQTASSKLNNVMKVCKTDVNGATRTLMSARLVKNLALNVLRTSDIGNVNKTLGMDLVNNDLSVRKGKGSSMIGRYFNNSVLASLDRFSNLFIAGSAASQEVVNSVARQAGYEELFPGESEEKLTYDISNEVYALAAGSTRAFNMSSEDLSVLLFGSSVIKYGDNSKLSLMRRLDDAKKGDLKDNLLISNLQISISRSSAPDKIYLPNNETVKEAKDSLFQAWENILANPEYRELGEDLIRYAFYTSGFSKSVGDFYEHIPNEWLKGNGFHTNIRDRNTEYESPYALVEKQDMIIKNLYRNNKLVPVVVDSAMKSIISLNSEEYIIDKEYAFLITQADSLNYTTGIGMDGLHIFKNFVKVKTKSGGKVNGRKELDEYNLFKRAGYTYNNDAIYVRINKLGITGGGNNIKEYFGSGETSIFKENNVTLPESLRIILNSVDDKSNIYNGSFETKDIENYEVSTPDDRIAFCFIK